MTLKTQKIFTCFLISLVVIGGFQALIYILNLNQPDDYFQVAFWIFIYLLFMLVFLYDLHLKNPGSLQRARIKHAGVPVKLKRQIKILFSALADRLRHLYKWEYFKLWVHFLLLPGFIYWSTISLFYINFGDLKIQEIIALFSSLALILDYWFMKEAFQRGKELVDNDIFVTLSMIKIYAAAVLYAAALATLRYYCFSPFYFSTEVFCFTFLLILQALYHHRRVDSYTLGIALLISAVMGVIGHAVYIFWGYNYFTAAVFLAAFYNLMWGLFHYSLDKALTWQAFWELLIISAIVAGMVFSVTNFRARILDDCPYYLNF
jgi:hypothetical protein